MMHRIYRLSIILVSQICITAIFSQVQSQPKPVLDDKYKVYEEVSSEVSEKKLDLVARPKLANMTYNPSLKHFASPNDGENETELVLIKEKMDALKYSNHPLTHIYENDFNDGSRFPSFEVGNSFYGDIDGSCPNDNTIAVSKSGDIISMMNGEVGLYRTNGSKLNKYNLYAFFEEYVNEPCDPKVEYDAGQDRFVMFVQACGSAKDKLGFGFSATNDPGGDWYLYIFDSDVTEDGSWADYPKMALTRDEVFVSLNMFGQDDKYRQSIIFQMDKKDGYAGNSLSYKIWKNIAFTPLVINSGIQQYYPGAYVVCSESVEGNSLTIYDISGNLNDAGLKISKYSLPVNAYVAPGSAHQPESSQKLDTGDSRMLAGYYQSGVIHAVHTVSDEGYGAVRYYRINADNLSLIKTQTITGKESDIDYAYGSIAPFTNEVNKQTSVVFFSASGDNNYPQLRAKVFDNNMDALNSKSVKIGPGYVENCYSSSKGYNRWGDYTGIAVMHGASPPRVWVAGSVGGNIKYNWWTYIAELKAKEDLTAITSIEDIHDDADIYPMPIQNFFNLKIDAHKAYLAKFILLDSRGVQIDVLYEGGLLEGENVFQFTKDNLSSGTYFLQITNKQNEIIKTVPVIVTR